jgi:hypothetical protein
LARTLRIRLGGFRHQCRWLPYHPIAQIVAERGLPFVFGSGYGPEVLPALFDDKPVLRMPFLISDFATMINSALSGRPRPPAA